RKGMSLPTIKSPISLLRSSMKKLKIEAIEVQSFVTQMNQNDWQTVKGGQPVAGETFLPRCTIDRPGCPGDPNTKYPICQVA
ncbi:MAG: pinensin family lanthipeptide, partial [Bacteroidota bacterium]